MAQILHKMLMFDLDNERNFTFSNCGYWYLCIRKGKFTIILLKNENIKFILSKAKNKGYYLINILKF